MQWEPRLPPGQHIELPGRGPTFVRDIPGPGGDAPTVVLLHGWTATADLNWFPSYEPLSKLVRVIAVDHHGHGRGIRSRRRFDLETCADDVANLCDVLDVDRAIVAGYSMGGPVAMLTWQRHRDLVGGLVLCATAPIFGPKERWWAWGMGAAAGFARLLPPPATRAVAGRLVGRHFDVADRVGRWARSQVAMADPLAIVEAGHALSRFDARGWLPTIDVPTSLVRTLDDETVPPVRQHRLDAIPGAEVFEVPGDHNACITNAEEFVPALRAAVTSVRHQMARREHTSQP